MSGLKRKLEGETQIKGSAGDAYHDLLKNTPHHFSNVAPHFIETCELHEGEHGETGSIITWRYKLGGKSQALKCVIEEMDEENKIVKFRAIEGDIMEEYKCFIATCHVIPNKSDNISIIKWAFEYEKKHPGIGEPSALLDTTLDVAKYLEDHHLAGKI